MPVSGTEGYEDEAAGLISQYESLVFEDVHKHVLHLIPEAPCRVLDIGAGTGRDAAALAARGHQVTAVEPTASLRRAAMRLHPSSRIEWMDSALPDLSALAGRGGAYALILLTAVWMHLDRDQRREAMPRVVSMAQPSGIIIFSLRHGPVPKGRRMFEVDLEETRTLAESAGCQCIFEKNGGAGGLRKSGVSWTRIAFLREEA
jgi:SAM-dependent methyltransferase